MLDNDSVERDGQSPRDSQPAEAHSSGATNGSFEKVMTVKPVWLVLLCGVLLGLSYPPVPLGFFAFIAFIPFFLLFERITTYGKAIRTAYAILFIFNAITLYWTGGFTHAKDMFLMIAGAAVLLGHPLFFLIVIPPFIFLRKHFGYRAAVVSFPLLWVAFEYLHSLSEYSFPWLVLGNTQSYDLPAVQMAAFTGVYGISFWILLINVLLYVLGREVAVRKRRIQSGPTTAAVAGILLVYLAPKVSGHFMMHPATSDSAHPLTVSMVQPNIDPFDKWTTSPEQQLALHESLTVEASRLKPDLIIWSETAIPDYILHPNHAEEFATIRRLVDSTNIPLLSGVPDITYYPVGQKAPPSSKVSASGRRYDSFNSSMLVLPHSEEIQKYAKMKLVPYAERVPYSDFLSFLNAMQWNFGLGGWGIGKDSTIFYFEENDGRPVRFANFICYESIYPGFDAGFVRKGAEFITVITNDSWWGNTSGAYQHRQIAVMRAVENRRWVVQCANGGISCIIDPYGRIVRSTALYTQAILTGSIVPLHELTFYTREGDWFAVSCLIASLFLLALGFGRAFYSHTRAQQALVPQSDRAVGTDQ